MPLTKGQKIHRFTKTDRASWPEGHKGCPVCRVVKPFSEFGPHAKGRDGLNQHCKTCRAAKAREDYAKKPYERIVLDRARSRARREGIQFGITIDDIVIPARCPVLGIRLERGAGVHCDTSPSIDKVIPSLGYVPGNVQVISNRANRLKSDATLEDLERIVTYLRERSTT